MNLRRVLSYLILQLFFVLSAIAQDGGESVCIRAGKIYTGNGEVIAPGVIVIQQGKIVDILPGVEVPTDSRVIDASRQTVIPGLVDAFTQESGEGDAEESLAPDIRAIDGYDFFESRRRTLAGGVTTTCVMPGAARLLTGQGTVVKVAGGTPEGRTLRSSFALHVILGEAPKSPPALYRPPVPPSSDNPIRPVERQFPASRMGQLAALRSFFEAAPTSGDPVAHEVLERKRPLFVTAHAADDLVKAILLAKEFSLSMILADAEEADLVVDLLRERNIPVVLDIATTPGKQLSDDDRQSSAERRPRPEAAVTLAKGGVRFALHAPADADMRELLVLAAYAHRSGLSAGEALRSVTLTPAEILGVEDRVGSIAKGKDADLVFLDGDPLTGTAVVERVLIDGGVVFERRASDLESYRAVRFDRTKSKSRLVIDGARIITGSQGVISDGLILIEDEKMVYVGRRRPIPEGARIVNATGLTATPGFLDIHSHIGLRVEQNETAARQGEHRGVIPATSPGPLSRLIRMDDPSFADAAAAGVTSVLLCPEQSGTCSVMKLAGGTNGAFVVREIGAIKLPISAGTKGLKALREQMERARKYHEEWEAYEKADKEKREVPKPTTSTPEKPDPITGSWRGSISLQFGGQPMLQNFTCDMQLSGHDVFCTFTAEFMGQKQSQEVKGTFDGTELRFVVRQMGQEATVALKVSGPDRLDGSFEASVQGQRITGRVSMTRVSASAAPVTERKGPRKDDQLEPFRLLLRREIPVLAVANTLPAVENAVRVLREEYNVDFFILGAGDADYASSAAARANVGMVLGPELLRERRGAITNLAEALASAGVPLALSSDAQSGTRHLVLQLAHAVRYGLDGYDALRAVTVHPARMLKLERQLGALERGCDADIVLHSGDPFLLTSRIRMVIVNGKIIHESK